MIKLSSFQSMGGQTWVLSEGFCVLGYFKTKGAARKRRAAIWRERKERKRAADFWARVRAEGER